jgi:hypothetical protein
MKPNHFKQFLAGCVLALLSNGKIAEAAPVLVDFDSPLISSGVSLNGGMTNADRTRLIDLGGGFVIRACDCADTPPNAAFGRPVPMAVIGGTFYNVDVGIPPAPTNFVSLRVVGTVPGQTAFWSVLFYDRDVFSPRFGGDLDQGLIGSVNGTTDREVSFSYPTGIRSFLFLPSGLNVLNEGIDTLTFNPPQIPEPGTVILLGVGLVGVSLLKLLVCMRAAPIKRCLA